MDVGGRPLNVEIAKSLPSKSSIMNPSLPLMMQQAVALQQMQFQQALMMQQAMSAQQAASRAATMKSATETAAARAAEISKKLKAEGLIDNAEEANKKSRSPVSPQHRSNSRSQSPIKYHRSRQSRSISPVRYSKDCRSPSLIRSRRSPSPKRSWRSPPRIRSHRSPAPIRSHHRSNERWHYKNPRDSYSRDGRRESGRSRDKGNSRDYYSSFSLRHRSRSASPRLRKSSRASPKSPRHYRGSRSPRSKRSFQSDSRSPIHHRGSRSSPVRDSGISSSHGRHSRSRSAEKRNYYTEKEARKLEKLKLESVKLDRTKKTDEKNAYDTKSSRESKEDENLVLTGDCSEHVAVKNDQESGHYKKSKLDEGNSSKQESLTWDPSSIGVERDVIEDKRFVSSPDLKSSHKRIRGDDSDIYSGNHEYKKTSDHTTVGYRVENRESNNYEKSSRNDKKHEKLHSATKEREYSHSRDERKVSHYSSSRSHKISRHSDERSSKDTSSRRKKENSEVEHVNHHRNGREAKESTYSVKRKDRGLHSTMVLPDFSNSSATEFATQQHVEVVDEHDQLDDIASVAAKQNAAANRLSYSPENYTEVHDLINSKQCPTVGYPAVGAIGDYAECEEPKLDVVASAKCNQEEFDDKGNQVKSYDQKSKEMNLFNNHQDHSNHDSTFFESGQKIGDTDVNSGHVEYKPRISGEAGNVGVHLSGFASLRSSDILKEDDRFEAGCMEVAFPQECVNHEPSNNADAMVQEVDAILEGEAF